MTRRDLPGRRAHELLPVSFRGLSFTVGIGRYSDGALAEVFIDSPKLASDLHADARDIAVLISIAVQHGTPVEAMRTALTRLERDEPAGLAGAVLDAIAQTFPDPPDAPAPAPGMPPLPAGSPAAAVAVTA